MELLWTFKKLFFGLEYYFIGYDSTMAEARMQDSAGIRIIVFLMNDRCSSDRS